VNYPSLVSHRISDFQSTNCNMPVSEDMRTCPLTFVSKVYASHQGQGNEEPWETRAGNIFNEFLSSPDVAQSLPSLNLTPNHELTDGQLVRFRGMVQDMLNPEIYMAEYETKNLSTGIKTVKCGRYRDVLDESIREEILEDSPKNVLKDRSVVYCVSIPGENPWVTEVLSSQAEQRAGPSGAYQNPLKRALDPRIDENQQSEVDSMEMDCEAPSKPCEEINGTNNTDSANSNGHHHIPDKRSKGDDGNPVPTAPATANGKNNGSGSHTDLNLPLPTPKGKAVIVKLYDQVEGDIKVCDMLDMVGIISMNPALAVSENGDELNPAPLPPPSLVPRLHVIKYNKMVHNNPLAENVGTSLTPAELVHTRNQLLYILTQAMLGDALAAEYLLYHLLSKVYTRKYVTAFGKMTLNLFHMNSNQNWIRRISTLLSLIIPSSHYLPLSIQKLENTRFVPEKDFENNRLVSGILQLPASTHLIVDETTMSNGQLSANALQNLVALGNVISWQKISYDFKFHQQEYDTDIPVLVMSEGRSMLPSDFGLMVKPDETGSQQIDNCFKNIGSVLNQDLLNRIRVYLTHCRNLEYKISDSLTNEVEEDFVRMRQESSENQRRISADDLHSHLVLAKLVSISKGNNTLNGEDWARVKQIELERRTHRSSPNRAGINIPEGAPRAWQVAAS